MTGARIAQVRQTVPAGTETPDWARGACYQDLEAHETLFFAASGDGGGFGSERQRQKARARAVCRPCPILRDCLAYALETSQLFGVWGGLTPSERKRKGRSVLANL